MAGLGNGLPGGKRGDAAEGRRCQPSLLLTLYRSSATHESLQKNLSQIPHQHMGNLKKS
jgi:hypothetical protein